MKPSDRYLIAAIIVLVDVAAFVIPLTAFVAAYIIIARPPAFMEWATKLYQD